MTVRPVKIVSDGTSSGTHVTTEDGSEVAVTSITWHLDVHDPIAAADLEVVLPRAEVTAEAVLTGVCPYCGHAEEVDPG
jgi:hypothetical protein